MIIKKSITSKFFFYFLYALNCGMCHHACYNSFWNEGYFLELLEIVVANQANVLEWNIHLMYLFMIDSPVYEIG